MPCLLAAQRPVAGGNGCVCSRGQMLQVYPIAPYSRVLLLYEESVVVEGWYEVS